MEKAPREHVRELAYLLTPTEVSAWLKVSERTLAQWRWRGDGPLYVKVGAAVRYRQADMEAWLSSQSRRHTSQPAETKLSTVAGGGRS